MSCYLLSKACEQAQTFQNILFYKLFYNIYFLFFFTDPNFTWSNTGAKVFGSAATQNEEKEEGLDDDSDEIYFEPIVSLPEVNVCCNAVSSDLHVSREV